MIVEMYQSKDCNFRLTFLDIDYCCFKLKFSYPAMSKAAYVLVTDTGQIHCDNVRLMKMHFAQLLLNANDLLQVFQGLHGCMISLIT